MLLALSLLALALGPLVFRLAGRLRHGLALLDGFVIVAIGGLGAVHILPGAVAVAGPWVLGAALLGFAGPVYLEKALTHAARRVHLITLATAMVGLALHGFFDGVGLGTSKHSGDPALALAVLVHRLPVGLTLWWLLVPLTGPRLTTAVLATLGLTTVAGDAAASSFADQLDAVWFAYVQAFIAGSLLHVVLHRPGLLAQVSRTPWGQRLSGVGALLAIAWVSLLLGDIDSSHHVSDNTGFAAVFVRLAEESAPALLLAFALAGLMQVALPVLPLAWLRRGTPFGQTLRGVAFGLPLPICSCGVVPLYQGLVRQAVPATAGMAFLVATPELGIDAVLLSLPLLGTEMTILRVAAAVLVALAVGYFVGRVVPVAQRAPGDDGDTDLRPWFVRLKVGLSHGFGDIVDHSGPWLLLGLAIAALIDPLLQSGWLSRIPTGSDVVLFTLLGMPSYVCASGATPLVAILLFHGASPGAALAFLLSGPATNVTTFGILAQLHGRRIALLFAAAIAAMAIGIGWLVNRVFGAHPFELPELGAHHGSTWLTLALIALALVFAASIVRQGPRAFLGQVLAPYDDDEPEPPSDCCH